MRSSFQRLTAFLVLPGLLIPPVGSSTEVASPPMTAQVSRSPLWNTEALTSLAVWMHKKIAGRRGPATRRDVAAGAISRGVFVTMFFGQSRRQMMAAQDTGVYEMIKALAERDPESALQRIDTYRREPWAGDILDRVGKIAPGSLLAYADQFAEEPYAEHVLKNASSACIGRCSERILSSAEVLARWRWAPEIVHRAALEAPMTALIHFNAVAPLLWRAKSPVLPTLEKIHALTSDRERRRAFQRRYLGGRPEGVALLVDDIHRGRITLEEAWQLSFHPADFNKALIDVQFRPGAIGRWQAEKVIKSEAYSLVLEPNRRYREPDSQRFSVLAPYSARDLYVFLVDAQEEMLPSTFAGFFRLLLARLPPDPKTGRPSGSEFLKQIRGWKLLEFVQRTAEAGLLGDFAATLSPAEQDGFFYGLARGIARADDPLGGAVALAEAYSALKVGTQQDILFDGLQESARTARTSSTRWLYEVLQEFFREAGGAVAVRVRRLEQRFRLGDLTRLPVLELQGSDRVIVQRHLFYADNEGENDSAVSYASFHGQYRWSAGWSWEDRGSYVVVQSRRQRTPVTIYANKPRLADEGNRLIDAELARLGQTPSVLVHRGHAIPVYLQATLARVNRHVKLVYLGSCGGYAMVKEILARSPQAHLLVTKQQGAMVVNDHLLRFISETLASRRDLVWPDLWNRLPREIQDDPRFKSYVRPDLNIAALFIKAYHRHSLFYQLLASVGSLLGFMGLSPLDSVGEFPMVTSDLSSLGWSWFLGGIVAMMYVGPLRSRILQTLRHPWKPARAVARAMADARRSVKPLIKNLKMSRGAVFLSRLLWVYSGIHASIAYSTPLTEDEKGEVDEILSELDDIFGDEADYRGNRGELEHALRVLLPLPQTEVLVADLGIPYLPVALMLRGANVTFVDAQQENIQFVLATYVRVWPPSELTVIQKSLDQLPPVINGPMASRFDLALVLMDQIGEWESAGLAQNLHHFLKDAGIAFLPNYPLLKERYGTRDYESHDRLPHVLMEHYPSTEALAHIAPLFCSYDWPMGAIGLEVPQQTAFRIHKSAPVPPADVTPPPPPKAPPSGLATAVKGFFLGILVGSFLERLWPRKPKLFQGLRSARAAA